MILPLVVELAAWFVGGAVAGAAIEIAVITIAGKIDLSKIKSEMIKRCLNKVMVKAINNTKNQITLEDMESGSKVNIQGDGISSEIYVDQRIYV